MVVTEVHPGSRVDPHAATSSRRRGTSGSSTPSGFVVSTAKLATIPIRVKDDANVAISDGCRLSSGDELDGVCVDAIQSSGLQIFTLLTSIRHIAGTFNMPTSYQ